MGEQELSLTAEPLVLSLCFQSPSLPMIGGTAPGLDTLGAQIALLPPQLPGDSHPRL